MNRGGGSKPDIDIGSESSDSDIRLQEELLRICRDEHNKQFNVTTEDAERQKKEYEHYEREQDKRSAAVQADLDKTQSSEIEHQMTWYKNLFTRPGVPKTTSGVVTHGSKNEGQPIDILPTSSVWGIITGGIDTVGNLAANIMGRPTSSVVAIGMENVGNSCYINAALQCLATVLKKEIPIRDRSKTLLITEFNGLIKRLQNNSGSPAIGDFEMQVFKSVCAGVELVNYAGGDRQYDGTRFIQNICEAMHIDDKFTIKSTASYKCLNLKHNKACNKVTEQKIDTFGRWAALTTPTSHIEGSLGLSNIVCPSCHSDAQVMIETIVESTPEVLAVFIPKFRWNDATRAFESVFLKFEDFLIFGKTTYKLVSVLNHFGGNTAKSSSGHYTACCLRNKIWYNINDSKVTKIPSDAFHTPDGVCTKNAYALFYIQVHDVLP